MPSFYDGKVRCPDCKGECVVHYDHVNHLGETVDWPEQCWTCGASGLVNEAFFEKLKASEVNRENSQG